MAGALPSNSYASGVSPAMPFRMPDGTLVDAYTGQPIPPPDSGPNAVPSGAGAGLRALPNVAGWAYRNFVPKDNGATSAEQLSALGHMLPQSGPDFNAMAPGGMNSDLTDAAHALYGALPSWATAPVGTGEAMRTGAPNGASTVPASPSHINPNRARAEAEMASTINNEQSGPSVIDVGSGIPSGALMGAFNNLGKTSGSGIQTAEGDDSAVDNSALGAQLEPKNASASALTAPASGMTQPGSGAPPQSQGALPDNPFADPKSAGAQKALTALKTQEAGLVGGGLVGASNIQDSLREHSAEAEAKEGALTGALDPERLNLPKTAGALTAPNSDTDTSFFGRLDNTFENPRSRMMLEAGLGMMAAGGQPGATALGSIGQGGMGAFQLAQARKEHQQELDMRGKVFQSEALNRLVERQQGAQRIGIEDKNADTARAKFLAELPLQTMTAQGQFMRGQAQQSEANTAASRLGTQQKMDDARLGQERTANDLRLKTLQQNQKHFDADEIDKADQRYNLAVTRGQHQYDTVVNNPLSTPQAQQKADADFKTAQRDAAFANIHAPSSVQWAQHQYSTIATSIQNARSRGDKAAEAQLQSQLKLLMPILRPGIDSMMQQ